MISIVTPWLDHRELAEDYFAAMAVAAVDPELVTELLIVDNGSDPELEFAELRIDHNAGFCTGNNAGLAAARGEIVVFCNNDVAPIRAGWLDELLAPLEPGVLVGPKIRGDLHGQVAGRRYPYLDGWLLAGYRDEIRAFGGWNPVYDEAGPAYYSDNDFALRARHAGMTLREVRRVGLRHKVSKTAGPADERIAAVAKTNYGIFVGVVKELVGVEVPA